MGTFVAIDFETSHARRDSACSVALVRAVNGRITKRIKRLIRPPRREFMYTWVHGLKWADVRHEPAFPEIWEDIRSMLDGARCMVAHNASFDRSVLRACCERYSLECPGLPFACTMKLARQLWDIYPTKLPDVCDVLGIPLNHHDALSDTEAAARIALEAGPHTFEAL